MVGSLVEPNTKNWLLLLLLLLLLLFKIEQLKPILYQIKIRVYIEMELNNSYK
jgi:hypothetical protein